MKPRITIREVAKEAGVSIGTASRALNRAGRVSEAAIAAVSKAARRLGYEPDAIAQSMRTRSSGAIGLIVSDLANPLLESAVIDGVAVGGGCASGGRIRLADRQHA